MNELTFIYIKIYISCLRPSMQSLVAVMWCSQSMTLSSHLLESQHLRTSPLLTMKCWSLMSFSLQNIILALRFQATGIPERGNPALPSSWSEMMTVSCALMAQSPKNCFAHYFTVPTLYFQVATPFLSIFLRTISAVEVNFNEANYTVAENGGQANISLCITGQFYVPVWVIVEINDGTATSGLCNYICYKHLCTYYRHFTKLMTNLCTYILAV